MRADLNRILPNGKIRFILKRFVLSIVIAGTAVILYISGFPLPYFINNHRLSVFAKQLDAIPLPSQTKKDEATTKKFGNLGPCSKHGDYYAEFQIDTTLTYSQLRKYYDKFFVQVPEINSIASTLFRGLGTHGPIMIEIEKFEGVGRGYKVFAWDSGYWHNDFRCW